MIGDGPGWSLEDLEITFRHLFLTQHPKQRSGTNIVEALLAHTEALNRLAAALERSDTALEKRP